MVRSTVFQDTTYTLQWSQYRRHTAINRQGLFINTDPLTRDAVFVFETADADRSSRYTGGMSQMIQYLHSGLVSFFDMDEKYCARSTGYDMDEFWYDEVRNVLFELKHTAIIHISWPNTTDAWWFDK